ncbi:MAG: prepilin-type N-terminal cleavage/methylation domain-containing protein [bacterium]
MKNNDSGFTLIEILVSINIGSIIIVIALFFYLFVFKFSINFANSFNEEIEVSKLLLQFENKLERLEKYEINISQNSIIIPISQIDTISICDTLLANVHGYSIKNIKNVAYIIQLLNGESVTGKLNSQKYQFMENQIIKSENISSIYISFEKQSKKYSFRYITPYLSKRRFINITNND